VANRKKIKASKQEGPRRGKGSGAPRGGRVRGGANGAFVERGLRLNRPAGAAFEDLVALQARLLAPHGCPWDREQTHESLRTYLLEEAYEVLDALESGDPEKFAEELGDLLLQVVFHAQLAKQEGKFNIADVIRHIHGKLVRRHPHVFGEVKAKTAGEVVKNWEQIKAEERKAKAKGERAGAAAESILDGVPRSFPAVMEAYQLTRKAARVGFDWDSAGAVLEKLREESAELNDEIGRNHERELEEETGDLLFAAVNVARFLKIDPEIALKKANRKFERRFKTMEAAAARKGKRLGEMPASEMDSIWEDIKRHEAKTAG
jgi:tetrapyrrole methylase family protein / MazG family protein